ncbi:MAG: hypothetical protein EAZ90_20270 [Oscillatoriales cyanobacterium]|nr:MAG: hypothetical protein EAZ90_20270 [Oscillatoriales cyanobacterium]
MECREMTNSPLEQINLLDTDYADILAHSSNPSFEMQLIKLGIDATEARTTTNFLTLVRQRSDTPASWAALAEAWEAGCGFEPNLEHLQQILELLWNHHQRKVEND